MEKPVSKKDFGKIKETGAANMRVIEKLTHLLESLDSLNVVVFCSVEDSSSCLLEVLKLFRQKYTMSPLSKEERSKNICWICENIGVDIKKDDLEWLSESTAGFTFGDLNSVIAVSVRESNRVTRKPCLTLDYPVLLSSVERMKTWQSKALGFAKVPSVKWEDIGGLEDVRKKITEMIEFSAKRPQLSKAGIRQCGLLMWGPPGTGKTLVAKAVATEFSLNFLSIKGPELLNMYIGQSEENVRDIFRRAKEARPCLIFFDELDSLAPNRGRSGDSGGVMDRIVSQLLAELDSLSTVNDIFLLGATNRPDMIDPSLLRPGRFDRKIYLGLIENVEAKIKVLRALTRKFNMESIINWEIIIASLPSNTSGADLYSLVTDAVMVSVNQRVELIKQGKANESDALLLSTEDFCAAALRLQPSVSTIEMWKYKEMFHKDKRK
ncbi:peroxisomal ATPase PEX6-like isoform X2 [Artemia franciscana]|uniref:peroxisomal ATPase PEX6-like isoform X2 n=1 Tax=Artemia franciscana TaxID=6661 RepID=UPI0032DA10A7